MPPKLCEGTERVVSFVTEELIALCHDVTLSASGDAATAAERSEFIARFTARRMAEDYLALYRNLGQYNRAVGTGDSVLLDVAD